jgi:hypothetical protein
LKADLWRLRQIQVSNWAATINEARERPGRLSAELEGETSIQTCLSSADLNSGSRHQPHPEKNAKRTALSNRPTCNQFKLIGVNSHNNLSMKSIILFAIIALELLLASPTAGSRNRNLFGF